MGDLSTVTEMDMHLAESQSAWTARPYGMNFLATGNQLAVVGTNVQDQLLPRPVKMLKAKPLDRLHRIFGGVAQLKAKGQSFETICSPFPDFPAN